MTSPSSETVTQGPGARVTPPGIRGAKSAQLSLPLVGKLKGTGEANESGLHCWSWTRRKVLPFVPEHSRCIYLIPVKKRTRDRSAAARTSTQLTETVTSLDGSRPWPALLLTQRCNCTSMHSSTQGPPDPRGTELRKTQANPWVSKPGCSSDFAFQRTDICFRPLPSSFPPPLPDLCIKDSR